jgi:hypothetical protein
MRRWRLTSAAVVDSAAEQRSAGWACWRGNAAGLGGWTFVTRISLTTLQSTGMGFFGLYGSTAALATTLTLPAVVNRIGIGFQRGTHTRWQLVANDDTGAPTLTDMRAHESTMISRAGGSQILRRLLSTLLFLIGLIVVGIVPFWWAAVFMLSGTLLYGLWSKPPKQPGDLLPRQGPSVIGPDLLGFSLTAFFVALPN